MRSRLSNVGAKLRGGHDRLLRVFMTCAVLLWPAVALAQTAPPQPNLRRYPALWVGYLVIMVLLALVVAVSLFPSKRSHQD